MCVCVCVCVCVSVCVYVCLCVCEGINGQMYVISLDRYALICKTSPLYSHSCSVCVCGGGGVSLSQVEAGEQSTANCEL